MEDEGADTGGEEGGRGIEPYEQRDEDGSPEGDEEVLDSSDPFAQRGERSSVCGHAFIRCIQPP